jgi:hypothetical protein
MAKQFEDEDELPKKPAGKKGSISLEDDEETGTKKGQVAIVVSEDDDCEFGDTKLMRKTDGLDRVRPAKGDAVRFAILPGFKPKKAMNHYIDKKGTYRCLTTEEGEGICCKQLGASDLHFAALVVHYTNANTKTGKYTADQTDTEFEIKYVYLSRTNFADISALVQEDERPEDFDIVMTHRENGIGYKLSRVSKEARWKKTKSVHNAVLAAAEKFEDGVLLTKKLGKKLNAIEWKQLLSTLEGSADEEDGDNSDL